MVVRKPAAAWLMQIREQIGQLARVAPDWDSYGAAAVDPEAIQSALDIADALAAHSSIAPPVVTATPHGHVGLCWDTGDRSIDASIDPDGAIEMVVIHRSRRGRDREVRTSDVGDLVSVLTEP